MKTFLSWESLGALAFSLMVIGVCYASPHYPTVVNALGDIQADAYRQLGAVAAQGTSVFVSKVHAFGNGQVYVYEAVVDTMNTSSNSMGASVAHTILQTPLLVTSSLEWFREADQKIQERFQR